MQEHSIIAIDLGGTRIKMGVVKNGKLTVSHILRVESNERIRPLLPQLKESIIQLSKREGFRIGAIGMAFPGIVDSDQNKVMDTSAKYTDAPSLNLVKWAKETFNLPFRIENDARLACLGEWRYGAGRGVENLVMLTLGTGIGTSVIINGKLLRGKHFQGGILGGHMVIDYKNQTDQCSCGKYGCVEAVASMWMIGNLARRYALFENSLLAKANSIDWEIILKLTKQGDALSKILKQHCLDAWGAVLINLVHAYDPEVVVIGGGISHSEKTILPFFEKTLKEKSWSPGGLPEVRVSAFPDNAALLGAAVLFEFE